MRCVSPWSGDPTASPIGLRSSFIAPLALRYLRGRVAAAGGHLADLGRDLFERCLRLLASLTKGKSVAISHVGVLAVAVPDVDPWARRALYPATPATLAARAV
jgi:hypothetical protein